MDCTKEMAYLGRDRFDNEGDPPTPDSFDLDDPPTGGDGSDESLGCGLYNRWLRQVRDPNAWVLVTEFVSPS